MRQAGDSRGRCLQVSSCTFNCGAVGLRTGLGLQHIWTEASVTNYTGDDLTGRRSLSGDDQSRASFPETLNIDLVGRAQ